MRFPESGPVAPIDLQVVGTTIKSFAHRASMGLLLLVFAGPGLADPPNDTIIVGLGRDVEILDLAKSWRRTAEFIISPAYETLVNRHTDPETGDMAYLPAVAKSWEMAEDGLSWMVELEPGHRFDDGSELTADSVKFTFERILGINRGSAATIDYIEGVDILDDYRVRFRVHQPHVLFVPNLTIGLVGLINPKVRRYEIDEDYASQWLGTHTAGSGPYRLTSYEARSRFILEANPHYTGKIGTIKRIIFQINGDDSIRALLMMNGEIDFAPDLAVETLESMTALPHLTVDSHPSLTFHYLALNTASGVMSNIHARKAVQLAMDYNSIAKVIFLGHAVTYPGPLPAGMIGADPSLYPLVYDLDKARQLLRQGGVKPGTRMTIVYPRGAAGRETMALMMQADLNAIGLDVRLEQMTQMAAIERLMRGTYDAFLGGWYVGNFDPAEIVNYWFNPDLVGSDTNMARYYNQQVGGLLDRSLRIFDPIERGLVIREALALAAKDVPYVYLTQSNAWMVRNKRVKGYIFDPLQLQNINFEDLSKSP